MGWNANWFYQGDIKDIRDMGPGGIPDGFNLSGGKFFKKLEVCPGTIYWILVKIDNFIGSGAVGVTWSTPAEKNWDEARTALTPGQVDVRIRLVVPMDARWGIAWFYTDAGSFTNIRNASFGPATNERVSVDCNFFLRNGEVLPSGAVGINVNYLTDNEEQRKAINNGPDYKQMLQTMNVGALRYPGGEKADTNLFAPKPFTGPPDPKLSRMSSRDWPSNDVKFFEFVYPHLTRWKIKPMDFGSFVDICGSIRAEPHVVIPWDSINGPPKDNYDYKDLIATSAQDLKDHAVGWARYAAQTYPGLTFFFEFSNESYLGIIHDGKGATADDYARNLRLYADGMRGVNPWLRIGANGPSKATDSGQFDGPLSHWWEVVLSQSAQWIDYLAIHPYILEDDWNFSWSDYENNAISLVAPIQEAEAAIQMWARKEEIRIRITEFAPIDYSRNRKWAWWPATLAHALLLIDQVASSLMQPKVDTVLFWNTRWFATPNSTKSDDQIRDNSVVNAVHNDSNTLTATGLAISFVASFFRNGVPVFTTSTVKVKTFAMKTGEGLRLVLINKSGQYINQTVDISHFRSTSLPDPTRNPQMYVFTGNGLQDPTPHFITPNPAATWSVTFGAGTNGADLLSIGLRPYSATAFNLVPDGPFLAVQ